MTILSRVCLEPGCSEISTARYCAEHTRAHKRIRNADRPTAAAVVTAGRTCTCTRDCRHHLGRPCGATDDLTADHVVPLDLGGTNTGARTVLCRRCNSAKGAGR